MIHNVAQPDFEQFVSTQLEDDPNVEIRKGVSFVSCSQVRRIVEEPQVRLRYIITCVRNRKL